MSIGHQASPPSFARNSLRQKILNVALNSPEFRTMLAEAADDIRALAKPTATEATVESAFERVLYAHLKEIGLRFDPEKELGVDLKRHVTRGRTDSRLGALIIEYKRPSLLQTAAEIEKASAQLKEYLTALSATSQTPMVGILTNGLIIREIHASNGTIRAETGTEKVSSAALLRITRHFISLALTALTPENLIRDFCGSPADGVLFQTARVLNEALSTPLPKTQMLHAEWGTMFRLAHDDHSQQKRIEERRHALGQLFQIEIDDAGAEYRALFALHTAYAIVLKFMAYRTVSDVYLGRVGWDYRSLAGAASTPLRSFCGELEDGEVFRRLGIVNLLEGDFFSWYCDKKQWTSAVAASVGSVLNILARYEEADRIFEANEAPDLFRDLYQAAVPRVVRSSFGEFYTPYWLAENVLDAAAPKKRWRAIDPCCGSGTFVIAAISKLRKECTEQGLDKKSTLKEIVSRVAAIDLNPLSVMTTRINYFIHISNLLSAQQRELVIPVYLGDAAAVPERVELDGVECLSIELKTMKAPVTATLPVSLVHDTPKFMQLMLTYERHIRDQKKDLALALLKSNIPEKELNGPVTNAILSLTDSLIKLEANGWNGIWARILSNFLTTACLGDFSVVIGNPPWIDWKNLPEGYRNRIKAMCLEKGLFSGAGRTGGINLNVCALIAYVAATNWLSESGRLAFLMPRELAIQGSYEGWRRLGQKWRFLRFYDWSKAGHPFDPVKEDFMTFVFGKTNSNDTTVPVVRYRKKRDVKPKASEWSSAALAAECLDRSECLAGQVIPGSTTFTFAKDHDELDRFALVAGDCGYIGREGVQFYPQELQLFRYSGAGPKPETVWLTNIQVQKAQHKLPSARVPLETRYLQPLVTAPQLEPFRHNYGGLIVAFPYESSIPTKPIEAEVLAEKSRLLLDYYENHRATIESLSSFNARIRGPNPGAFYGLARTGPYSFADTYVAFRKDTKWCAAVVSAQTVPWGGTKRFAFQSHAVSMCERSDGEFISEREAHYICAIFNSPIVGRFIVATSDDRSFKVRPPIHIPLFNAEDKRHDRLAELSRQAHRQPDTIKTVQAECERIYLNLCEERQRA